MTFKKKEINTGEMPHYEAPPIKAQNLDELEEELTGIEPVQGFVSKKDMDMIAFMEEGITIRLSKPPEKNAPTSVPVWVNGRGAEVLIRDRWQPITYLPIGPTITVKRKYVEVLARAKPESVDTQVEERDNEDPKNHTLRSVHVKYPFTVLNDPSPKGADWLSKILMEG